MSGSPVQDGDWSDGNWDGRLHPGVWIPLIGVLGMAVAVLIASLVMGVTDNPKAASAPAQSSGDSPRRAIHEHADFAVFIRGQQLDFHQPQYVSVEGKEYGETVHIHDPHYTVVHVHMDRTTWDEFFHAIGFELTDPSFIGTTADKTCLKLPSGDKLCASATETFKFYVNGVKVDGVSSTGIHDLDRVLISFGPESEADVVAKQLPKVSNEACIPSERCLDRVPKDASPEPCSVTSGDCVKPGG